MNNASICAVCELASSGANEFELNVDASGPQRLVVTTRYCIPAIAAFNLHIISIIRNNKLIE